MKNIIYFGLLFSVFFSQSLQAKPGFLQGANPGDGKINALVCSGCHNLTKQKKTGMIGPPLWNVVGRKKAGAKGYDYSKAFRSLKGRWSYEALNRYLKNVQAYAPGTKMAFPGVSNDAQRANVIAFLRSLSGSPAPLPKGVKLASSGAKDSTSNQQIGRAHV